MKIILPALVAILSLGFVSCEKQEPPHCDDVYGPSQEFLNYWYFPQDSYWVYELEGAPGTYDTVTVIEAEAKYYNPDEFAARVPCEMVYRQTLAHSNDSIFKPTPGNPRSLEKYEAMGESLYLERLFNASQFAAGVPIFNLPVKEGRELYANIVMADTSLYLTPENEMAQTVEIHHAAAATSGSVNIAQSFSFTNKIGITKRVYTNGRVWNLVDFSVR